MEGKNSDVIWDEMGDQKVEHDKWRAVHAPLGVYETPNYYRLMRSRENRDMKKREKGRVRTK